MKIMTFALICIGIAVALSLVVAVVAARVTVREMMKRRRRRADMGVFHYGEVKDNEGSEIH